MSNSERIDLTNKYIPNVYGELRDLFIAECERQDIPPYRDKFPLSKWVNIVLNYEGSCYFGARDYPSQKELLTIEDFKPIKNKHTKRIKVPCNFKSFYEAVSEILNSGEKYFVDGVAEDLSWYVKDENFLSDETLGYLLQNYAMLYRYENKTLTKYEVVIDYIDSLATVGDFTDLNDYLQGTVDKGEFVKMCKFIVDLEEGE